MPHCKKQMISFFLTTKCNLRCVYCYNSNERSKLQEKTLSLEIAKAGIDEFFSNNRSRHIRFYGPGEPTQKFKLMKEITSYAREKAGNKLKVELQTNAAFGSKVREWILNNLNIIWVSFDGTPDIQNKQRPFPNNKPSAPTIEKNVKWLFANRQEIDLMVGARVTITNLNISRQIEMIDYFRELGIKHIWTDPEFPSVDKIPVIEDAKKFRNFHFDMDTYVHNFIEAHKYAKKLGVFYGSFLTCNFDGESKINCRTCTPVPHLTPDGYISACDMVVYGEDAGHMDCFIYGKWTDKKFEYDYNKIKALRNRNVDNMEHCKNCEAKLHCGGHCLGEVVNTTGKLDGQIPLICKGVRTLYEELGTCEPYEYLHS